jgi:hypothetical protein
MVRRLRSRAVSPRHPDSDLDVGVKLVAGHRIDTILAAMVAWIKAHPELIDRSL